MAQAKIKSGTIPLNHTLQRGLREAALFICGFSALYLVISLSSYHPADPAWSQSGALQGSIANLGGPTGAWFADIFLTLFGYLAYLFPVMIAYAGYIVYADAKNDRPTDHRGLLLRSIGFLITIASGCALASLHDKSLYSTLPANAGGILGEVLGSFMSSGFHFLGATVLLLALFLSGFTLFTNLSWFRIMDVIGGFSLTAIDKVWAFMRDAQGSVLGLIAYLKAKQAEQRALRTQKQELKQTINSKAHLRQESQVQSPLIRKKAAPIIQQPVKQPKISARVEKERQVSMFKSQDTQLPPLSLLDESVTSPHRLSKESLEALSRLVELKLADFGITVEVVAVHPGPVITRFEIQPAAGVKVSQISNLAKDIARSLSAISVRVVEVIPGKDTIGIEIPNENREIVRLSETLKSSAFADAKSPLTLALGKDISGIPVVTDLAKMPHLLVAGTTGAGKSVALNAMILSILYNATPNDVRMIMVDPKMLELSIYDGIPHLLAPVVTDMKDANNALRWCVAEMENRYKMMAAVKVRNLAGFNRKVTEAKQAGKPLRDPFHPVDSSDIAEELQPYPTIVVVIDELADMMMVVGKKVEETIARLAQKARAAGIHLILATQRPSVDVLTGLIKANIPSRIAFQVSSKVDSRTILDQAGAEQLLGHGDMLYLPPGTAVPNRIHGAFVDDHEVHRVVDELKKQGKPQYEDGVLDGPQETEALATVTAEDVEDDPLYDQAVRIVTETRKASISGIQRRLKIGYNRAARMVEAMEHVGLVGPLGSNGTREVLAAAAPPSM